MSTLGDLNSILDQGQLSTMAQTIQAGESLQSPAPQSNNDEVNIFGYEFDQFLTQIYVSLQSLGHIDQDLLALAYKLSQLDQEWSAYILPQ